MSHGFQSVSTHYSEQLNRLRILNENSNLHILLKSTRIVLRAITFKCLLFCIVKKVPEAIMK